MGIDAVPVSPSRMRRADRLAVRSFANRGEMARAAAGEVAAEVRARLARQPHVRMVFAAAPSQAEMLAALTAAPGIDWARVDGFHMDEYIGLPEAAPQRFARWLEAHLFERVPFGSVELIRPDPDPEAAARAYAALLDAAPVDLVCLGIGVNGHIAFNEPHAADFEDPLDVRVVTLDPVCRRQQVDDGAFDRIEAVPERALTLTVPRLLRADRLFCVVPGRAKRAAVRRALEGPVETACPASILRRHADCTLYLDAESDPDA